jgi:CRISPR-associated protein (TIGR03986 family)
MAKGTIKRLVADRGFGFIRPDGGGQDVWFHASKVQGELPFDQLSVGTPVEYQSQPGERGPQASSVRAAAIAGARRPQPTSSTKPYRFLNPYNFVRFLKPPSEKAEAVPNTTLAAALRAAGVTAAAGRAGLTLEAQLLGRCAPPPHDRYVGLTGSITCTLEAVTPLFISDSEGVDIARDHKSYEFFRLNGEFAIPATSLRGMVRNVFEAVTNSCVSQLTDARLSYHLPPGDALKLVPARVERSEDDDWQLRLLTGTTRPAPGQKPSGPQYAAWVRLYKPIRTSMNLATNTPYGQRPTVDLGSRQHGDRCWALVRRLKHPRRNFEFWNVVELKEVRQQLSAPGPGERQVEGFLCITNQNIENKHDERFFFLDNGVETAQTVVLTKPVREAYSVLIRDYQQRHADQVRKRRKQGNPELAEGSDTAFSRFIVQPGSERLDDGDLVYAMLTFQGDVEFIVPVSVPRVSYRRPIGSLVPDHVAPCTCLECLCPACRTFGWVRSSQNEEADHVAYAGRIRFEHGHIVHSAGTLSPTPLAILSSPKPTTTRFYLAPVGGSIPATVSDEGGYDNPSNVLRGLKVYRHHGTANEQEYYRAGGRCDDQNRTVRDALLPGASFEFAVHFENLAPVELGALLWSLEMDQRGYHRLGFGKPLGFGSVRVRVSSVTVMDTAKRYTTLADDGRRTVSDWQTGFVDRFKSRLAERYRASDFEALPNVEDMRALLAEPPAGLPVHYPRTARRPDPDGKNFEWFMGNSRHHRYTLPPATDDTGLPLMTRDGTEIK